MTNYPLNELMPNGARVNDWLGTAMTAAEVAAKWISRVRYESGNDPLDDLDRAEVQLIQALEELRAVRGIAG